MRRNATTDYAFRDAVGMHNQIQPLKKKWPPANTRERPIKSLKD